MSPTISAPRATSSSAVAFEAPSPAARATPTAAELLPSPAAGHVDVGEAVARMVLETAFERKKLAREERKSAQSSMEAAQRAQIEHLRAAAEAEYAANVARAGAKIAGGAGTAMGGAFAMGDRLGEGKAAEGIGNVVGGGIEAGIAAHHARDASLASAAAKADEMRAGAEKTRLEGSEDETREARDAARSAMDFLREFQSTRDRTALQAASIRA